LLLFIKVTGDGNNDALALRAADVGLAMGINGTEIAREAAHIIILDDNFASIANSVKWGRCIFDNIRKFLTFQMTLNVSAILLAFIAAATNYGTPLNAVQFMWINLIQDTMAALALATEKPTDDLLQRKPYARDSVIITRSMWRNIFGQGLFQVIVLCILLYAIDSNGYHLILPWVQSGKNVEVPTVHYTLIFNTFVWLQIFNEFNSRKLGNEINVFDGLGTNKLFIAVIFITIFVQVLVVEFGGAWVFTAPLDWRDWLVCIFIGSWSIPLGIILRQIPVPRRMGDSTDNRFTRNKTFLHGNKLECNILPNNHTFFQTMCDKLLL